MMKGTATLLVLGSLAGSAQADCAATCLPDLPGGPFTCDEILNRWTNGDGNAAWMGNLRDLSCPVLEDLNCCDCTDCLCSGTTSSSTSTTTGTTEEPLGCDLCYAYFFGGNSSTPVPNDGDLEGFQNQFLDPYNGWAALDEHRRVRGCAAAALNGVDCSNCGCECGAPPEDIDCVQEFIGCGECSVTECGQTGVQDCVYNTTNQGAGLGTRCEADYQVPCSTTACPTDAPTTATDPITAEVVDVGCDELYLVDGEAVLNGTITTSAGEFYLGGTCDSAQERVNCEDLLDDYGAECYDCGCVCSNTGCNERAIFDETLHNIPSLVGACTAASHCVDPCTEYIAVPDVTSLAQPCSVLLQSRTLGELKIAFANAGSGNPCSEFKCCTDYADGGGIPEDFAGDPAYSCYVPPTDGTTTSTTTTTTTSECDIPLLLDRGNDTWSANQLIDRGLSCFGIANALGGIFDTGSGFTGANKSLENLTFFPDLPPRADAYQLAIDCGCQQTCDEVDCAGCEALDNALELAGFDTRFYFCEDISRDFNMDCSACGCRNPDDCDDPVLFSSGISKGVNPDLYDVSCNDLSRLGFSCEEIASYTAFHDKAGVCDLCNCTAEVVNECNTPCGGGQFGGNSSSGYLNTSEILTCDALMAASFSCEEADHIGCDCTGCGCVNETVPDSCEVNCNDLYLTCNELVDYFTCDELTHEIFDGCGCESCGCKDTIVEPGACANTCLDGLSCDDWVNTELSNGRHFYTCANLEANYGCNCDNCQCSTTTAAPDTTTACGTTSSCLEMDCNTVRLASGLSYAQLDDLYGCECGGCVECNPEGCNGYSCNEWITFFPDGITCAALETTLGCDCAGCESCDFTTDAPATPPTGCATTCNNFLSYYPIDGVSSVTCDDIRAVEDTLACPYLETFFGCDCSGCGCEDVPTDVCL